MIKLYYNLQVRLNNTVLYAVINDSNGKLIGEPILGAHPDKYRERMEKYLESAK